MDLIKKIVKYLMIGNIGGLLYCLIEILYRNYTHWTMYFVAFIAFTLIGELNEHIEWEMPLWKQMVIGSLIITSIEFITGMIVNVILGWNVWDYSNMPLNVMGQICIPFSIVWFFLSLAAIILDDYLRYWWFGEERPRYYF